MVLLDKKHLNDQNAYLPGTCRISFSSDDFPNGDEMYDVAVNDNDTADIKQRVLFSFYDGLGAVSELLTKDSDLLRVLIDAGIAPEDFDSKSPKLNTGYGILGTITRREVAPDELMSRFYIYKHSIGLLLYTELLAGTPPEAVLDFPDESSMLLQIRKRQGLGHDFIYFEEEDEGEVRHCNGHCPDCKCGGREDDYSGC